MLSIESRGKRTAIIIGFGLVTVGICSLPYSLNLGFSQAQVQELMPNQERNKALITEFYDEVFAQKNASAVDKYYSENFTSNDFNFTDRESHKKAYNCSLITFPDLKATIHDMIAEGDKVAVTEG
jgi:hypothetical protein